MARSASSTDAFEAFVARRAALVGAVSRSEATLLEGVAPRTWIIVVPNGIRELDDGHRPVGRGPRSGVLAVGRMVRERRPAEAASILGVMASEVSVAWIGDGTSPLAGAVRARGVPVTGGCRAPRSSTARR